LSDYVAKCPYDNEPGVTLTHSDIITIAHHEESGVRLTRNFFSGEFACNCPKLGRAPAEGFCNGALRIDNLMRLVDTLQRLRWQWGPLHISSGFRCWAYHEHLYGEKRPPINSAHLVGAAADIYPKDYEIKHDDETRSLLIRLGFRGIGWRLGASGRSIHLDVMEREQVTEWEYAS